MAQLNTHNQPWKQPPPPSGKLSTAELPLLKKLRSAYFVWYGYYQLLPKIHRHTLGQNVDTLFIQMIEATTTAGFMPKEEKLPYVRLAIRKLDTLKVLLMILWETKSIDNKKYITVSVHIDEIGRQLGGWNGQLIKNSLTKTAREK